MNTASPAPYQPSTLAEHPELTPDEIGRRFLKLIDSLKSFNELSTDRVRQVMRLPMVYASEEDGGFLAMTLPKFAWNYIFSYSVDPKYRRYTNAKFEFRHEKERVDVRLLEDISPVCGMDFNAYEATRYERGIQE